MLESVIGLLGGAAFRLIAGKLLEFWDKKTEAAREERMMQLQADIADRSSDRRMKEFQLQKDMGITEIRVQADAKLDELAAVAFNTAVQGINDTVNMIKPTGKWWVDLLPVLIGCWNQAIRPALATFAIWLWVLAIYHQSWVLTDWDRSIISAVIGLFIGERIDKNRTRQ